ncbi:MAG: hypothetical protein PWQ25_424 [Deferribacteres bacterium]|jgi:multidrug efflux pump subunit AcrA (membrane-fusion protein)|nr:acriflavin resistance protein AcrA/AcrE family [Deferribacteraceae bacterium]MDK2791561.1 hypothetical protein [Deferribacteres bacterium]
MKVKKILVFFAFLVLVSACSSNSGKENSNISSDVFRVRVEKYEVKTLETESQRSFTGQVISKDTVMLVPKVVGYLSEVKVKVGDRFKKGDVLAQIVSQELQDKRKFAEASVMEADNGLKQAEIGLNMAEANYRQALAQYELAEKTFKRFEKLYSTESVSKQEYDEVLAKYKMALEGKNLAEKNMQLAEEKLNQVKIKKAQAEAALDEVNTYISYTKLTAPFDGIVLEKLMDAGNLASYSTPVLKIGTLESEIVLNVPENAFQNLQIGQNVRVKIPSINKQFDTKIVEISRDISPATRTFTVKLKANDNEVIPGMYAEAYFVSSRTKTILVPSDYIFERGQLNYVFVDKNSVAEMRIVKVGKTDGNMVELNSGIEPGEVIVKPVENIQIKSGDILEAK